MFDGNSELQVCELSCTSEMDGFQMCIAGTGKVLPERDRFFITCCDYVWACLLHWYDGSMRSIQVYSFMILLFCHCMLIDFLLNHFLLHSMFNETNPNWSPIQRIEGTGIWLENKMQTWINIFVCCYGLQEAREKVGVPNEEIRRC